MFIISLRLSDSVQCRTKTKRLRLRLFIDLTEVQTTVLSMFTNRIQNTKINKFIMLAMASIKIDSKY